MAHKKAAGSTKNLKDSKPKYRGVKVFGGQKVVAGNIIIRQKGNKFECGKNVYMGRDFTILSRIAGVVAFKKKKIKRFDGRIYLKTVVEVFPLVGTVNTPLKTKQDVKAVKTEKPVVKLAKIAKTKIIEKVPVEKKAPAEKKEVVKKAPVEKKVSTKKASVEKKETIKKAPAKKTVKK